METEATPLTAEREAAIRASAAHFTHGQADAGDHFTMLGDLLAALDAAREKLRAAKQDVRDLAAALAEAAGALTVLHGRWKLKYPVFNEDGDWEALRRDIKRFEALAQREGRAAEPEAGNIKC